MMRRIQRWLETGIPPQRILAAIRFSEKRPQHFDAAQAIRVSPPGKD